MSEVTDVSAAKDQAAKTPLKPKKIAKVSAKFAVGEEADAELHGKFAMKILRQIARGADNPQGLAKAFFRGARQARVPTDDANAQA